MCIKKNLIVCVPQLQFKNRQKFVLPAQVVETHGDILFVFRAELRQIN